MLMNDALAEDLERRSAAFAVPLRMGSGFDEGAYDALCAVLRDCAAEWRGRDVIPKRAANVLLDLVPSVAASAEFYEVSVASRVHSAEMELDRLVRECLVV